MRILLTIGFLLAAAGPGMAAGGSLVGLELPANRPAGFTIEVDHDGRSREILLERHSVRAADFRVLAYRPDGTYVAFTPEPPATYRGRVKGEPGSHVFASLGANGLEARIVSESLPDWELRPTETPGIHEVSEPDERIEEPVHCGAGVHTLAEEGAVPASPQIFDGQHLAQIAFDVDFQYYLLKGSSVQNAIDAVEAIMNQVDFFYARDLLVTYEITHFIVRTTQFYFPTGGGNLLELFRDEWNTNQAAVVRDMAHLMTDKDGIEFGGLAYVAAVCNSWAYGWSLDSANIVGHELGHNWGSGHCHDLSPCNNMCGGCFFIAPATKVIKTAYRDSLGCLDDAGAYPTPLPPYAHPEILDLSRDELAVLEDTAFDVLGNDHDGNLDPLSIDGHDPESDYEGPITLSPGSGPEGRDELVYEPPGFVFPGEDGFDYTVGDGTGLQQVGRVTISVPARGLAGYWTLDDLVNQTTTDASNLGRHGVAEGGPLQALGVYDRALLFDGVDDAVVLPPLHIRDNHATFSAWVRRNGSQTAFSGILFSRAENTVAGLSFGNANELRYHWNGTASTYNWNSGLVVPDGQWVFVALVVEPDRATIYLYDGTLQSAVNLLSHAPEEFDGQTKLGHDSDSAARRFDGVMDDVRIYDRGLSATEILQLASQGGGAVAPNPVDGGHLVPAVGTLSWIAGLAAESHDVYFGEDYLAVRDATPASAEFVGNVGGTGLVLGGIVADQVYAWRVDELVGGDVVQGDVWLFTRVESGGHWKLDEASGSTAADADGVNDGIYQGGVQQGEPGATPTSGSSARFDGINDYVEIPPLNLDSNELTITGWARRDGAQSNFAGLVFSRGGNTTAGISTLVTGGLRYHWNDSYWDWDSGLVLPQDEWAFFALVVRPDMATIYLGQAGELSSAYNATLHGEEEFDGPLDLGKDGATGRYFRGWLDDVRAYRAALSPRDIEHIYFDTLLAAPAGELPGDEPLLLNKVPGNALELSWSDSCVATDVDYAVYEGEIGDFTSHVGNVCSTGGATTFTILPDAGDRYYLVVPLSENREGGYGIDSGGNPRGSGLGSCLPQEVAGCE